LSESDTVLSAIRALSF